MKNEQLAVIEKITNELMESPRLIQVFPMAVERLRDIRTACQDDQQQQALEDCKRAMTEAMASMRLSGTTDFAYQRLAVALERLKERGL